jgi:thiopeptide-type bacteriocin biosynthesis protein
VLGILLAAAVAAGTMTTARTVALPAVAQGTDTYRRELERYGGDEGIELAEQIHAADSDAVLKVLGMLDGEDVADARWKLCLYATDRLLADAGLDMQQRRDLVKDGAAGYGMEYPGAHNLDAGIGARWRNERAQFTALLDDTQDHPYEPADPAVPTPGGQLQSPQRDPAAALRRADP